MPAASSPNEAPVTNRFCKPCARYMQVRSALGDEASKDVRGLLLQRDFFLLTAERLATSNGSTAGQPAPVLALA